MTDPIAAARSILARPQHHIMPEERIVATYILAAFPQVAKPSRDAADAEMEPVNFATHGARALVPIGARHILAEPSRAAVETARDVARANFCDSAMQPQIDRIAAAILAAEARVREECARIAKEWCDAHGWPENIAAAIRAGGGR